MLASAREHYRLQQQITARGVVEARRRAQGGGAEAVAGVVAAHQLMAARVASQAVAAQLAEQAVEVPAEGAAVATALAGVTSAGFPLQGYFQSFANMGQLALAVATQIQDAARQTEAVEIATRADVGYARMLNLPSCARCIILAGAWYKWNAGFMRHPRCDCLHIPAVEADARGVTTNPTDAFESLSRDDQDRIFGEKGAEAIRLGADPIQVVNARRGMRKAQLFGREAWITTEGATRRGIAGKRLGAQPKKRALRLMPETLLAVADDRAHAIRLLERHGYITT